MLFSLLNRHGTFHVCHPINGCDPHTSSLFEQDCRLPHSLWLRNGCPQCPNAIPCCHVRIPSTTLSGLNLLLKNALYALVFESSVLPHIDTAIGGAAGLFVGQLCLCQLSTCVRAQLCLDLGGSAPIMSA